MKVPAYTLVETLVALALTALVVGAGLRGMRLLWSGEARQSADSKELLRFATAVDLLREDLWKARTVSLDAERGLTLGAERDQIRWIGEGDTVFVRIVKRGERRLEERFAGRLQLESSAERLRVELCRAQLGKIMDSSCARASTKLRR